MHPAEQAIDRAAFFVFDLVFEEGGEQAVAIGLGQFAGFGSVSEEGRNRAGKEFELGHGSRGFGWGFSLYAYQYPVFAWVVP